MAINHQLRDLRQVFTLKRLQQQQQQENQPTALASSVFSLDDIYCRWKQFCELRRRRQDQRPLYFVKVDIEECYDSIDQCRLFEIASRLLDKMDEYVIRRYVTVVAANGRLKRSFQRQATSLTDFQPSFVRFVQHKVNERNWSNMIFVDQVLHAQVNASTLLRQLESHLFNNIVKVNRRRYFKQVRGIAQGSVLSTLLCDIYYSDMEANRITVNEAEELLMRQVRH